MGTYRLSKEAKGDLIDLHQFGVRRFGEAQADVYFRELVQRFDVLAETPLLYQEVSHIRAGYRRSVCGAHSIYYRLDRDTVEIMAILKSQDIDLRFGSKG